MPAALAEDALARDQADHADPPDQLGRECALGVPVGFRLQQDGGARLDVDMLAAIGSEVVDMTCLARNEVWS